MKYWYTFGIVAGALTIFLALVLLRDHTLAHANEYTAFGGDYYTESYQAIAKTVNAIADLHNLVARGLSFITLAIGMFMLCFFGAKLTAFPSSNVMVPTSEDATIAGQTSTSQYPASRKH